MRFNINNMVEMNEMYSGRMPIEYLHSYSLHHVLYIIHYGVPTERQFYHWKLTNGRNPLLVPLVMAEKSCPQKRMCTHRAMQ